MQMSRMSIVTTTKPRRFEEEKANLDLAPMVMRGRADLQQAALIVMSVKKELAVSGKLLTGTAPAPFGCEEVKKKHGEKTSQLAS